VRSRTRTGQKRVAAGDDIAEFDRETLLKPEASIGDDELSVDASPVDD